MAENTPTPSPEKPPFSEQVRRVAAMLAKNVQDAYAKLQDIAGTNVELGKYHFEQGHYRDAVMRFRLVLLLNKKHKEAWLWLAKTYAAQGEKEKAMQALAKCLQLHPGYTEARLFLDQLKHPPQAAPASTAVAVDNPLAPDAGV